jgi:hypothetical protein
MKFCCTAFEYFAGMAGARGFGIFTTKSLNPKEAFVLQHRALDEGAWTSLSFPDVDRLRVTNPTLSLVRRELDEDLSPKPG